METLITRNKGSSIQEVSDIPFIKHCGLKKMIKSKEKILLLFVSNLKMNLFQIRKLSQMCTQHVYHLELVHLHSEEEFTEQNEVYQLVVNSTIADPNCELFDAFKVDFKYNISLFRSSAGFK